jgi:hypothetical protein
MVVPRDPRRPAGTAWTRGSTRERGTARESGYVPAVPPRVPPYEAFVARAKEVFAAIPAEYTSDVEDLVVHRGVKRHPQIEEVVTLGECEASPTAALTASGLVRSIVHLWYGSFVDLAGRDETFDWDAELVETVEHEVKHHLEDKAGVRDLEDEDDLFDAHARFRADLDVPAGWYRRGREVEEGVWAVDLDLFVEVRLRRKDFDALKGRTLKLTVLGEPLETEIPADADPEEVFTIEGEGLLETAEDDDPARDDVPAGDLHLVPLVR